MSLDPLLAAFTVLILHLVVVLHHIPEPPDEGCVLGGEEEGEKGARRERGREREGQKELALTKFQTTTKSVLQLRRNLKRH